MDYHAANDDINKAILQDLSDGTEDQEIRRVLQCYSIGATGADIIKELSKHTVPPLKKTAIYLDLYADGDPKKLKADIITDIMTRLNSLLMELCGICGEYYNNKLHEKPLLKCILCKQGCHSTCLEPITAHLNVLDENQKKCTVNIVRKEKKS